MPVMLTQAKARSHRLWLGQQSYLPPARRGFDQHRPARTVGVADFAGAPACMLCFEGWADVPDDWHSGDACGSEVCGRLHYGGRNCKSDLQVSRDDGANHTCVYLRWDCLCLDLRLRRLGGISCCLRKWPQIRRRSLGRGPSSKKCYCWKRDSSLPYGEHRDRSPSKLQNKRREAVSSFPGNGVRQVPVPSARPAARIRGPAFAEDLTLRAFGPPSGARYCE